MSIVGVSRAAWRTAGYALRGGDGRLLLAALLLAVVAATAVNLVGTRIAHLMQRSAQDWLGADLVLVGAQAPPAAWLERSAELGLRVSQQQVFPSMLFGAERGELAEIKAVDDAWPLRGEVLIDPVLDAAQPSPGSIWLSPDLARNLQLEVGDVADLGELSLHVTALLLREPERSGGPFSLAPRALIHVSDLPRSGLIGAGSRISHRTLLSGAEPAVRQFTQWLQPRLAGQARVQTLADSQQSLDQALGRALSFLRLAVLCAVLLSGVALLLTVRSYAEREQQAVALLKSLGWTRWQLLLRYGLAMLLLAGLAALLGTALGIGLERLAVRLLDVPELRTSAAAGLAATWIGPALAGVLLLACLLPSIWLLTAVPPQAVFKLDREQLPALPIWSWLLPLLMLAALAWLAAGDARLAAWTLGGLLALLGVVALLAWTILRCWPVAGASWRGGFSRYRHAPALGVLQITALTAGFAALAVIGVLSRDLLASWSSRLEQDTPNYFLINVRSAQLESLLTQLNRIGAERVTHAPVAVGRLQAINDVMVSELSNGASAGRLERNQNLSWSTQLGVGNRLISGRWFTADAVAEVSVASNWAEPLGVQLGDRLRLSVGEQTLAVTVTSVREVAWDTFAVNFFLVLEPSAASGLPHGHLVSLHLNPQQRAELDPLLRNAGNLSLIDIGEVLAEVRRLIERATLAVRIVFWFSIAAGVLVLLAAFNVSLRERMRDMAILRALGASGRQLRRVIVSEFSLLGAISGALAMGLAAGLGTVLARQVFQIELQLAWGALLLIGALATGIGLLLGSWAAERLLASRAIDVLRRS
jgi:putative ABC transport system permease protein